MNINFLLNPKKTIKFDEIEVTIEGCNPDVEQYVEELLYRKTHSDDARSELSRRYIKRLICCSIKDVKNLTVNGEAFKVKFKDQEIQEIDDYSYNVLMRLFESYLKKDIVSPIIEYYNKNKAGDLGIEVEEDKKKD